MRPGEDGALWAPGNRVAGGRFEIEAEAGAGGGGAVFRARDLATGERVALKVLHGVTSVDFSRFTREAKALAALQHPSVVRYIDHDIDEVATPFLAMEWLDGEDLRTRLARAPLTARESVGLARSVAETLAAIHARGFLHRDIKPGNLFLVDKSPSAIKLLDFGLARSRYDPASLTRTGLLVGTPGYISPEQAQGSRDVDGRADVFSLGCVLYKCLSGEAPFDGPNLIAVMTKVVLEEPRSLAELRPGLPAELVALVHRMLQKTPDRRPDSAEAVAAALSTIPVGADEEGPCATPSLRIAGLTGRELRVAAVLLIGTASARVTPHDAKTLPSPGDGSSDGGTDRLDIKAGMLELFVAEQKGRVHHLPGGARVITGTDMGTATEQAAWAARCALALRSMIPDAPMALATGCRELSGAAPMGDAIDRATLLLDGVYAAAAQAAATGRPAPASVTIDDLTASLLDSRFEVRRAGGAAQLVALHESGIAARMLLGKTTTIVGRDWELSAISALFQECVDGPGTGAALVTAPAGLGKSRLAHELVGRFRAAAPDVEIWTARCDSVHAGAPLHLLRLLLGAAMQLGERGEADDRSRHVRDRVGRDLPAATADRVAELLGEIMKIPFPDEDRPALRAARADAILMGEQMRWAFETFVAGACALRPVVLVLDDVHWGDRPSLRFVEGALWSSKGRPLMVLMLARPDLHDVFPRLSMGDNFQEIRLKPLTTKAGERLVEEVLGGTVGADVRARLVARAEGNAFYLEELVRTLAERRRGGDVAGDALPETVIASVQARIGALDDETRRLLRAASVFGEVFWANGVTALLGGASLRSIGPWLDALVAQEILVRRPSSRFAGESELVFRHALVREAAYAMLTEGDRALGHRLAGMWLEQRGEQEPLALALHYERGGEPERAAHFHIRGAEQALSGLDLDAAASLADRAIGTAVSEDLRAQALATLCHVHMWRLARDEAATSAEELQHLTARNSAPWILARTIQLSASLVSARPSGSTMEALLDLMEIEPTPRDAARHAMALSSGVLVLALMGQFGVLEALLAKLDVIAAGASSDALVRGWVSLAHTYALAWRDGDAWSALGHAEAAGAAFAEADDLKNVAFSRVFLAICLLRLGAFEAAERALGASVARHASEMITMMHGYHRALLALDRGELDLAGELARERIEGAAAADPMRRIRVAEACFLQSEIARRTGDAAGAERILAPAIDALRPMPLSWQVVAAYLARTRVALGRPAEALAIASQAMAAVDAQGGEGFQGLLVRLARAEALDAAGDHVAARAVLDAAHARLLDLASRITDAEVRASFLERVEEHARIVALAAAWRADAWRAGASA